MGQQREGSKRALTAVKLTWLVRCLAARFFTKKYGFTVIAICRLACKPAERGWHRMGNYGFVKNSIRPISPWLPQACSMYLSTKWLMFGSTQKVCGYAPEGYSVGLPNIDIGSMIKGFCITTRWSNRPLSLPMTGF